MLISLEIVSRTIKKKKKKVALPISRHKGILNKHWNAFFLKKYIHMSKKDASE